MYRNPDHHYPLGSSGVAPGAAPAETPVYQDPTALLHDFYLGFEQKDGKELIDAVPLQPLPDISRRFEDESGKPDFDYNTFYSRYFLSPEMPGGGVRSAPGVTMEQHIEAMWPRLTKYDPKDSYTRIGLPRPATVPGERFSESYYGDLLPTVQGQAAVGRWENVRDNIDNCAYQIERFGYVYNGARFYYEGRSQLPVFSRMVRLLADHNEAEVKAGRQPSGEGERETLRKYLPQLLKEYNFWMKGSAELAQNDTLQASQRVVRMPNGTLLNRNFDGNTPRPESYRKDIHAATEAGIDNPERPNEFYRHVRAAAESCWDFSGRWFADGKTLKTIETTNIVPVDLNCLLYDLEKTIARAYELDTSQLENKHFSEYWKSLASQRAAAINTYMYDSAKGFYFDYHWVRGETTGYWTMAGAYPLQSGLAPRDHGRAVLHNLQEKFLQPGGFATTLHETEEQWDGLNGWAALQKAGVEAAHNYGDDELALEGCIRWVKRNCEIHEDTGQMHEKPLVGDEAKPGGGGEYVRQTGFGMTNGSVLELQRMAAVLMETIRNKPSESREAAEARVLVGGRR